MSTFTIRDLEIAINYYRNLEPAVEADGLTPSFKLSGRVRKLATPYALMIFYKRAEMALAELTAEQAEALTKVPARYKADAAALLDQVAAQ